MRSACQREASWDGTNDELERNVSSGKATLYTTSGRAPTSNPAMARPRFLGVNRDHSSRGNTASVAMISPPNNQTKSALSHRARPKQKNPQNNLEFRPLE